MTQMTFQNVGQQTHAKWDELGRFVCPFNPNDIAAAHAVYVELKNATSVEKQRMFQNLHFDIGENQPIHHRNVVFENVADLVRFTRTQYEKDVIDKTDDKYELTGHPILCVLNPIKNNSEKIDAIRQFLGQALSHAFAGVTLPHRVKNHDEVFVRPVIIRQFDTSCNIDENVQQVVGTINASLEKRYGAWQLNLPVTAAASISPFHYHRHVGAPGLLPRLHS